MQTSFIRCTMLNKEMLTQNPDESRPTNVNQHVSRHTDGEKNGLKTILNPDSNGK